MIMFVDSILTNCFYRMPPKKKKMTRGAKQTPATTTVDHTASVVYVMTEQDGSKMQIFTDQQFIMDYMNAGNACPNVRTFPNFEAAAAFMNSAGVDSPSMATVTPDKKPAAKLKSTAASTSRKSAASAKASQDEKKARLAERVRSGGKGGKPYLRISYFPSAIGKDNKMPVALEFLDGKDSCYWLFKPDMFVAVIETCYSDDPLSSKDFFDSLMEVGLRDNPYGLNHAKKSGSYNLYALVGFVTVSSFKPDMQTEMEHLGNQMKKLFNDSNFREWYKEAVINKTKKLEEYIEKDDLWVDMDAAPIRIHEKDHLDALFINSAIVDIMDKLYSKAPNLWSDKEKEVAYRSEEIPANIL
jgi:hypothetical protein